MKDTTKTDILPKKLFSRIDIIGSNGNEGTHYGESGPLEFSNDEYEEGVFDDYGQRIHPCVGHAKASDDINELQYIVEVLGYTEDEGLTAEVVYQALMEMKQDPTLSPSEAIQFGYSEWIK
jgi:hypothetical protein